MSPGSRPTAEDRIRAALWFADRGFGVFSVWSTRTDGVCRCPAAGSCSSPGKHPVSGRGFVDATRDPDRIRTLLHAGSSPNWGMVPPEGVFAWDVDSDEERARLARLEAIHGPLPPTLRTNTANGQHMFWRWPAGLERPTHKMFSLVTRWGSGRQAGYVLGPRSVHQSGAVYEPAGDAFEIAELPTVWAEAAVAEERRPATLRVNGEALPDPGGRHDWLRDRARYYRGFLADPGVLRAALLAENARLAVPKTAEEVGRAIGDVFAKFPLDPLDEREERVERGLGEDEIGLLPPPTLGAFPDPPAEVAFEGLLGDCAMALAEGTDASAVGLLGCLIAFCGALIPGRAYFHRLHTSSPFVALIGESSVGRKGTAMWRAHDAMTEALGPVQVNRVILDGLNSGEGLISALHYKQTAFAQEPTVGLVFEEEYATLLASRAREGSTLDPKMRAAFDGGPLSNRRAHESQMVSPPYWLPALIAITPVELRRKLEADALQSGSANRWLYLPVTRRPIVPANTEPRFADEDRERIQSARRTALEHPPTLTVDRAVISRLAEYADWLPEISVGPARDLTRRLAVIAFRVALVHALTEGENRVVTMHLERALALTEYARAGLAWVFGAALGNRDAELLYRHLMVAGSLRHRTIERQLIRDPLRRQDAIDDLVRVGFARVAMIHGTGGRPRTELHLAPFVQSPRSFGPFGHVSNYEPPTSSEKSGQNVLATKGQNGGRSRTEAGQKQDETGLNAPLDIGAAIWVQPCHDYPAHRNAHRNTPAGWICPSCHPSEVPA